LQQVDGNLKEMGMGQTSAWGMARLRPLEYRRKVDSDTLLRCMLPYPSWLQQVDGNLKEMGMGQKSA